MWIKLINPLKSAFNINVFERINLLLLPLKSSENHMTSDDFRENKNNKLEAKFGHDPLEIPIIYSLVKYFTFYALIG